MESYNLSLESIESLLMQVDDVCKANRLEKKEALRLRLTIEETLLNYADRFGPTHKVELISGGLFAKNRIQLHIFSDRFDPFRAEDELGIMSSLMAGMERNPRWRYAVGINVVSFPMYKKKVLNNLVKIILALVLGIAAGFWGRSGAVSIYTVEAVIADYITPITSTYTNLLCVMAILMIFFTFPLSIAQTEDTETLHGVTKHILRGYLTFTVMALAIVCGFCLPKITFSLIGTDGPNVLKSGLDVLLDFVPHDLLSPFINFNCMQVMLIGLMFGCAFVAMGEKSRPLMRAFDSCNLVAVLTNNYLTKLIPLYVLLTAFTTVVQIDTEEMQNYMSIAYIVLICAVLLPAILAFTVSFRLKVSPRILCRKLLPAFLINLSSASIGASYTPMFNEMNRDGGIEVNYCTVSCNLGTVLFKPIYTVFLSVTVLRFSAMFGLTVTPVWLILTLLLCVMLSLAIPNIPGGAASVILLLISQMGFSTAAARIAVAFDVVLQFIIVPVDIFCLQCISFLLAEKEGKLNLEKLRNL